MVMNLVPSATWEGEQEDVEEFCPFNGENEYIYFRGFLPSPGQFIRLNLENYLVEANIDNSLPIYICEIQSQNRDPISIPFHSSVIIGIRAYIASFKEVRILIQIEFLDKSWFN